ncbi:MAG: hypothetical protein GX564_05705 [Oligosphaeraceae bacterium]|nr:hypothetical protein [Oligosphaeraceae bacterium]
MTAHYTYTPEGMSIFGSRERFNRVLYGGHQHDEHQERYFTFAGDTPIFMGAASDYSQDTWCYQAKNGVLLSGLALTEGYAGGGSHDIYSSWFHDCSDVLTTWRSGYITYRLSRFSPYFPQVMVDMAVYPLIHEDGFLVQYDITTDQRVIFCAGFGGITKFFGRFDHPTSKRRDFSPEDCTDNQAEVLSDHAAISGPNGVRMQLKADFPCEYSLTTAEALAAPSPGLFLGQHPGPAVVVRVKAVIPAHSRFRGHLLVLRNNCPERLRSLLGDGDLDRITRSMIRDKHAMVSFHTPDAQLDATVPDTVIALDASFHGQSFYHGAIGYHAPFLGWRGWYAPVLLGWSDRVRSAIESHFATITRSEGQERVWWDGADRPDLDHEGTQYHHLQNSSGHLTALLHRDDIYDMQEVAVDMTLFYLQNSADLETGGKIYDRLLEILSWEARILDPDGDGLYQNFLNTWISDGHSYNGAGCAQASIYNFTANLVTARLGRKLGREVRNQEVLADQILQALYRYLWLPKEGILAESIDRIGNRLLHPSPELSTTYLAINAGVVNAPQAWSMLRWTERNCRSIRTVGRGGRLYFSSNWLPKKYSTCGIFSAENACLALAYYRCGQPEKAFEIVQGLLDAFALSPYPGSITHVLSGQGGSDGGDIDFTDVSSCYLQLLLEGLWGVRFQLLEEVIYLTPQLPPDWEAAELNLPAVSLSYHRRGNCETLLAVVEHPARKVFTLPLRQAKIEQLLLNGKSIPYTVIPGWKRSFLQCETSICGKIELKVYAAEAPYPRLRQHELTLFPGNQAVIAVDDGVIDHLEAPEGLLQNVSTSPQERIVRIITEQAGLYDCLVRSGEVFLPLTIEVRNLPRLEEPLEISRLEFLPLEQFCNCALTEIHQQEFRSPRPQGYSIGMRLNGRYAWEWNHFGHNALQVDDTLLRKCGGVFATPAGWQFATPPQGRNAACVSLWDNFPTSLEIPLSGRARALAVLYCGSTNAMQTAVCNARLEVHYAEGQPQCCELRQPDNFDDFLLPVYQKQNEAVYVGAGTHALVQVIRLDPQRELCCFRAEAIANEVILDVLALTLAR